MIDRLIAGMDILLIAYLLRQLLVMIINLLKWGSRIIGVLLVVCAGLGGGAAVPSSFIKF